MFLFKTTHNSITIKMTDEIMMSWDFKGLAGVPYSTFSSLSELK